MFCADRSVITTLDEATTLALQFPAGQVGVVIDSYHVWWDPRVEKEIARAGRERRIFAFHIDDWVLPLPAGALTGRGLPGEGCADLAGLHRAIAAAGYDGPIEVEVLSERVWDMPGDEVLARLVAEVDGVLGTGRASTLSASG